MCKIIKSVGHRPNLIEFHKRVLYIPGDGSYMFMSKSDYRDFCEKHRELFMGSDDYNSVEKNSPNNGMMTYEKEEEKSIHSEENTEH